MNSKLLAKQFLKFREQQGGNMSADKLKRECECCGEVKPLSSHFGLLACTACISMRGSVKNRPLSVVKSIREFHGGLQKFLNQEEREDVVLLHGQATPVPAKDNSEVVKAEELAEKYDATLMDLQAKLKAASVEQEEALREKDQQIGKMAVEIDSLKAQVGCLVSATANDPEVKSELSQIIMDIGQSCIDKRSNISKTIYRRMRKLQARLAAD